MGQHIIIRTTGHVNKYRLPAQTEWFWKLSDLPTGFVNASCSSFQLSSIFQARENAQRASFFTPCWLNCAMPLLHYLPIVGLYLPVLRLTFQKISNLEQYQPIYTQHVPCISERYATRKKEMPPRNKHHNRFDIKFISSGNIKSTQVVFFGKCCIC